MNTPKWVDALASLGITYHTRSSGVLRLKCPFHHDTEPSLLIWKNGSGRFKCYSCHERGSLIDFLEKCSQHVKLPFSTAAMQLWDRIKSNLPIYYEPVQLEFCFD